MPDEIPIVLTATVIPNNPGAGPVNIEARLREYISALEFYLRVAPVIFLENSSYPLEQHPEFQESDRLRVHRFQPSRSPERGKGYQEFEMLDAWISSEARPPKHWLKITGRYQILNISSILNECSENAGIGLLIDQIPRTTAARTYLFYVSTEFYKTKVHGLYRKCDDQAGAWIERVLFRELKGLPSSQVRAFATQLRLQATVGTSGQPFPVGRGQWFGKQILRRMNRLIDRQYLWYSK